MISTEHLEDELLYVRDAPKSWAVSHDWLPAEIVARGYQCGVELGVAMGGHAHAMLDRTRLQRLWGVDEYRHRPDYDDLMNHNTQRQFEAMHRHILRATERWGQRFKLLRMPTLEAARLFVDGSLDFVYIDADHSSRAVEADLRAWRPKIRAGGLLCGHDVSMTSVRTVVAALATEWGLQAQGRSDDNWWIDV